tara:strand:+ start:87 stop:446 length:360 start_codon:yes stop_codon:yes gene_type:complete
MKTIDVIFKSVPRDDWSKIEEEQACIVVTDSWEVFAGYHEAAESYDEESGSFDLQACHELNIDGKTWDRIGGREGMSFCTCPSEYMRDVFVPKEDLDLDAIMKLFKINELEGASGYGTT